MRDYCFRRLSVDEANDALAEVFLVAWRKIDELPEEPLPWLYGVARNVVRNAERSHRRRFRLGAKLSTIVPQTEAGPEQRVVRRAEERLVIDALATLNPEDRELLRLRAWEELSRSELAAILDISPEAVDMRTNRAKKRMAKRLRANGYTHEESTRPRAAREGGDV